MPASKNNIQLFVAFVKPRLRASPENSDPAVTSFIFKLLNSFSFKFFISSSFLNSSDRFQDSPENVTKTYFVHHFPLFQESTHIAGCVLGIFAGY